MTRLLLCLALVCPAPAVAAAARAPIRGQALPGAQAVPVPVLFTGAPLSVPAVSAGSVAGLPAPASASLPPEAAPFRTAAVQEGAAGPSTDAPPSLSRPAVPPSVASNRAVPAAATIEIIAEARLEGASGLPAAGAAPAAGQSPEGSASDGGAAFDGRRPLRLVIMGPPASGKGTVSKRVAEDYGVVHVSAGDLLRQRAASDPAVDAIMKRGDLVPVELVVGLVRERLAQPDARERGFILDGFPRRRAEAEALSAMLAREGIALDAAIEMRVPKAELLRRMRQRGRPDDTDETFRNRLRVFSRETKPAMALIAKGTTVITPHYKGLDKQANYLELKRLLDAFLRGEAPPGGWKARLLALLPAGAPGARRLAVLLAAWNFLTIATYYILAPVRGAFLLHNFGPSILPWVYMAGAAVTGLAVWGYGRLSKLPRRALIGGLLAALVASLAGWWVVGLAASQVGWVSFAYYIFGDLFSIVSVTLLWTYANDRFGPGSAKSYFGFIAAAGPLGAILGSLLTKHLVAAAGVLPLLLAAALVFAGVLPVFFAAERVKLEKTAAPAPAAPPGPRAALLPAILKSRFLGFLALLVFFERLVPDFGNYIFNAAAYAAYPEKERLVTFGATYGLWQNVFSLAGSLLLTSWILRRLGVGKALMGAPASLIFGLLAYASSPVLGVAVAFNALEGLQRYTWFKAAKEATYTVGSKDVIYRFKAFIEMFVYRFARGLAGLILLLLTSPAALALGPRGVALAGVPFALAWTWVAWRVGREFAAAEKAAAGQ